MVGTSRGQLSALASIQPFPSVTGTYKCPCHDYYYFFGTLYGIIDSESGELYPRFHRTSEGV